MSSNVSTTDPSLNLKKFFDNVKPDHMIIKNVHIRDSVLKGKFIWLQADIENNMNGKTNPTFIFLRGDSVSILPIISVNGKKYIIATDQLRAPTGSNQIEAIAGMLDNEGNANSQAIKELEEEAGIIIQPSELKELGYYYSSQGIMDEKIKCFYFERDMTVDKLAKLTEKFYGDGSDFETIRLKIINATWKDILETHDAKMIASYAMYCNQK